MTKITFYEIDRPLLLIKKQKQPEKQGYTSPAAPVVCTCRLKRLKLFYIRG